MARRREEEHREKISIFEKMTQDLAWQVKGAQGGAFRGIKTFLFSKLQWEEAKEASSEGFDASMPKEVKHMPTTDSRSTLPLPVGFCPEGSFRPTANDRSTLPSPIGPSLELENSSFRASVLVLFHKQAFKVPSRRELIMGAFDPQGRLRRSIPKLEITLLLVFNLLPRHSI
ncbi:hypothetical protein M9H77_30796 [Catharanthus roseus]|uniref:Uncharacterized protein n=1 Tax=Catharanthus roseus TaxID=4058 RepID=A0ACC0A0B2_CATRO|nr:hypothetical protein M9H77_30796 [Catharanthus roseus]